MLLLSPQSILLTVVLGVLTLVAAVATFLNYTEESLLGLIIWVAIFAILIYDTECLVTGSCGMWSWVRTVLWSIIPIFVIVVLIMAMVRNRRRMEESSRRIMMEAEQKAAANMNAMMASSSSSQHRNNQGSMADSDDDEEDDIDGQ